MMEKSLDEYYLPIMLFQFEHMELDNDPAGSSKWEMQPWKLMDLKRVMTRW